ncbi:MAG: glycoside hydrolase family 19 protein [Planctomycetota bacterium]
MLREHGGGTVHDFFRGVAAAERFRAEPKEIRASLERAPECAASVRGFLETVSLLEVDARGIVTLVRPRAFRMRRPDGTSILFGASSRFRFGAGLLEPVSRVRYEVPEPQPEPVRARVGLRAGGVGLRGALLGETGSAARLGLSVEGLREIMPSLSVSDARRFLPHLTQAMQDAAIDTPLRQAAFLAHVAHESNELTDWVERGPRRYFNRYEPGTRPGRRLGNTRRGDGFRFRGRGPLQLTGRDNYARAGRSLGLDLVGNPDLVSQPGAGFATAAWFWNQNRLNRFADREDFVTLTERINGGQTHLAEREAYYRRAREALGLGAP